MNPTKTAVCSRRTMALGALTAACAALFASPLAQAADYPTKSIRLVVPYAAGGPTDILARLWADDVSKHLGQSVVVDNVTGGNTIPGALQVAKAAPDGYTLLLTTGTAVSMNQYLYKSLPYNPDRDLTPVGKLAENFYVIAVNPQVPAKSLKELIAYAKANPDKLSVALSGIAGPPALGIKLLETRAGISLKSVQYKGDAAYYVDLLAGRVDMTITSPVGLLEHVQSGKLRAVAVSAPTRLSQLPDVEAVAETYPGFQAGSWFGIVAPAGTPPDVIAKLNNETQMFTANPAQREKMGVQGMTLAGGSAKDLADFIAEESAKWKDVIKDLNLSMD